GLAVEDIDSAYKVLTEKGFSFSVPPEDRQNLRIAFFQGPEDITIELIQPLA
ncbi:MAG: VOC family protein, partial [Deltaproteobacteria bacterium]|nr:VOC family protein [Deltaproteobacteria bacterium]